MGITTTTQLQQHNSGSRSIQEEQKIFKVEDAKKKDDQMLRPAYCTTSSLALRTLTQRDDLPSYSSREIIAVPEIKVLP